jgi:hypothetical protein
VLFKILGRTAGVVAFALLILLRVYFIGHVINSAHRNSAHAGAAYNGAPQANYRNATLVTAADNSGWILFNSIDPQTGLRIRHARLTASSGVLINGHPAPPNVLELLEQGSDNHRIELTLQAPATCAGITTVHAVFGTRPAAFAVKPVDHATGCKVDVVDYATVLQSLLDADTLTVSAGDGPEIRFAVSGLSWD